MRKHRGVRLVAILLYIIAAIFFLAGITAALALSGGGLGNGWGPGSRLPLILPVTGLALVATLIFVLFASTLYFLARIDNNLATTRQRWQVSGMPRRRVLPAVAVPAAVAETVAAAPTVVAAGSGLAEEQAAPPSAPAEALTAPVLPAVAPGSVPADAAAYELPEDTSLTESPLPEVAALPAVAEEAFLSEPPIIEGPDMPVPAEDYASEVTAVAPETAEQAQVGELPIAEAEAVGDMDLSVEPYAFEAPLAEAAAAESLATEHAEAAEPPLSAAIAAASEDADVAQLPAPELSGFEDAYADEALAAAAAPEIATPPEVAQSVELPRPVVPAPATEDAYLAEQLTSETAAAEDASAHAAPVSEDAFLAQQSAPEPVVPETTIVPEAVQAAELSPAEAAAAEVAAIPEDVPVIEAPLAPEPVAAEPEATEDVVATPAPQAPQVDINGFEWDDAEDQPPAAFGGRLPGAEQAARVAAENRAAQDAARQAPPPEDHPAD